MEIDQYPEVGQEETDALAGKTPGSVDVMLVFKKMNK